MLSAVIDPKSYQHSIWVSAGSLELTKMSYSTTYIVLDSAFHLTNKNDKNQTVKKYSRLTLLQWQRRKKSRETDSYEPRKIKQSVSILCILSLIINKKYIRFCTAIGVWFLFRHFWLFCKSGLHSHLIGLQYYSFRTISIVDGLVPLRLRLRSRSRTFIFLATLDFSLKRARKLD
jgi:hypothetical protein